VFTNGTITDSCVLRASSSSAASAGTGSSSRRKMKRDGTQVTYQHQVFAALRLLDPARRPRTRGSPSPYTSSRTGSTSSISKPSPHTHPLGVGGDGRGRENLRQACGRVDNGRGSNSGRERVSTVPGSMLARGVEYLYFWLGD